MRRLSAAFAVAYCLAMGGEALAAQTSCPLVAARYNLIGYPNFSANFQSTPSAPGWETDVALRVNADGRSYWFMFDESGAAGDVSLIPATDPSSPGWRPPSLTGPGARVAQESGYYAMDDALNVRSETPHAGAVAPTYFLAPDLAAVIADDPSLARDSRVRMPKALFKLSYCQSQMARVDP